MPLVNIKTAQDLQTEAQQKAKNTITRAIDAHVESRAKEMEYNSAAHLASYVSSSIPSWAEEAQTFVSWRDEVWIAAINMLETAEQTGEVPDIEEVISSLPEWPEG